MTRKHVPTLPTDVDLMWRGMLTMPCLASAHPLRRGDLGWWGWVHTQGSVAPTAVYVDHVFLVDWSFMGDPT